jgi:hypothetical protein
MNLHRVATLAVTALIAGGSAMVAAPTASAASASVDCLTSASIREFTIAPGESFTLNLANCPTFVATTSSWFNIDGSLLSGGNYSIFSPSTTDFATWVATTPTTAVMVAPLTKGPARTILTMYSGPGLGGNVVEIVATVGTAADAQAPLPIPDWIQAYGRASSDASCNSGWNPSWQEWPNGGRGGYVCTRSIPALG